MLAPLRGQRNGWPLWQMDRGPPARAGAARPASARKRRRGEEPWFSWGLLLRQHGSNGLRELPVGNRPAPGQEAGAQPPSQPGVVERVHRDLLLPPTHQDEGALTEADGGGEADAARLGREQDVVLSLDEPRHVPQHGEPARRSGRRRLLDRKSTRLNSSHGYI